jgi:hypothetical protein
MIRDLQNHYLLSKRMSQRQPALLQVPTPGSFHADFGGPDDLRPPFGLGREEHRKFCVGQDHRRGADRCKLGLDRYIREPRIDVPIEPLDDVSRGADWHGKALPNAGLVTGDAFADRWDIGQDIRASCGCDAQSAQGA